MTDQIIELLPGVEKRIGASPFGEDQPVAAHSAFSTDANLYGVNHPGTNHATKIARIALDGTTTTFNSTDFPLLASAHVDGGSLAEADRLRLVAIIRGVSQRFLKILNRVAASATPAAGEFKSSGAAPITITLGDAENEGASLELWMLAATDIQTSVLDGVGPTQVLAREVFSADAPVVLQRLVSGGS